ncbi:MAG TPA: FUSC family protein [Xanthobacteraceae bacterium]|nr:FUSC family protein [Xanthobacteraceae bacterium]
MSRFRSLPTILRTMARDHRAALRLSVRVTASAVLSLIIGQSLHVPLVLWTVLTAIIVTQTSIGRSLKATIDYFIGTLGGAVFAGAVAALIPHESELAVLGVLAIAMAPLVILAAINPSFNAATATAAIVVLAPTITHGTPIESAFYRVVEVALGALTGLAVSLTVFPARAHTLAVEDAARMLDLTAQALEDLFAGFTGGLDMAAISRIQERLGKSIARLDVIYAETKRERMSQLISEPDPGPLLRTLLRLRHDLVIVGRAAMIPLPAFVRPRLGAPLARLAGAAAAYLRDCSAALIARSIPPPLTAAETAFEAYVAEIGAIRQEGLTRSMPSDELEHLFTLGFALDQLHQHFRDLRQWVAEQGGEPKVAPEQIKA